MSNTLIQSLFQDVYDGQVPTQEAGHWIHKYCTTRGLNPTYDAPFTMLMITDAGREKVGKYEELMMSLNWLIAKLAANSISIEQAIDQFFENIDQIAFVQEGICGCLLSTEARGKYMRYFECPQCRGCPTCNGRGKNFY